ncbi:hypothetical protein A33Q_2859 [Indibacter alkaliphilus LW1]|uniref:Uncharacterized protein n=1 Tax=Indibacter alkaliphilus (strain CCUG 57479 / KCTC 22604 / LW1) TaxID=1189612 RepID=S2D8G3_INDAL|nr:hypothetical protein A33Q_2859 [Indibacter alkaliphilus LW1]
MVKNLNGYLSEVLPYLGRFCFKKKKFRVGFLIDHLPGI